MLRSFALATTCCVFVASQAQAQIRRDNWPNWYIALSTQVSYVSESELSGATNTKLEFDVGHAFAGAIGYRPPMTNSVLDDMRFELETQYRHANFDTANTAAAAISLDGDLSGYSLMANAYYDVYTGGSITPYFGGGAGITSWEFESPQLNIDKTNVVLSYQAMTGIYYSPESIPQTDWGIGYRYFSTVSPEFENATGQKAEMDYDSHNLELQARFRF